MSEKFKKRITTPEFRLCFPNVFKPTSFEGGGEPKFEITMLFPKNADLGELKGAARDAVTAKFPNGVKGAKSPFRDGNEKVDDWGEAFRDAIFVKASAKYQPGVCDRMKHLITDEGQVYSGCYARAVVHAYGYDMKGNKGVSIGLDALQILRDGEPIGASAAAAVNLFDDLEDPGEPAAPAKAELEDDIFA